MPLIKWVQLICAFLLVLLPPAIHYRNLKYNDRRTNIHKWFTKTAIRIWICTAISSLALTVVDTRNSIRQQKEQWEWTTGGTNLPAMVCTPLSSNRFSFEVVNGSPITPLRSVHFQLKLMPWADLVTTNQQEEFQIDNDLGTLNPYDRKKAGAFTLIPRATDGRPEIYSVSINSLSVVMWGVTEFYRGKDNWTFRTDMAIHYVNDVNGAKRFYHYRTSSDNYSHKTNWDGVLDLNR